MAFGFGYKPMQTLVLADGEYEFIIQRAQEHTKTIIHSLRRKTLTSGTNR